ncbi:uncharacterized protein RCO7_05377 [Rhynchosporium graminicola]|uniref:Transcription factor domain-containing protein n=1 Tax=Rhynchosporium graminicola TaxID=2792576 RepID=A0A1E1L3V5_9HELO|nr:uncharacterized protein RCO7_05377 [Rhynchosporium commune]
MPSDCVFLEAPMTKQRLQATQQIHLTAKTDRSDIRIDTPTSSSGHWIRSDSTPTPGFLGETSYSATLDSSGLYTSAEIYDEVDMQFDPHDIEIGVDILKYLPDQQTSENFLELYISHTSGLIGIPWVIMRQILASIFSTYGHLMKSPREESDLEEISKRIIRAGYGAGTDAQDANGWAASLSGTNLRWDTLGLLYVAFAYACLPHPDHSNTDYALIDKRNVVKDRSIYVRELKTCVESCIKLSRNSIRPFLCNLLLKNMLLETSMEGDNKLSAWRLNHDLVAVATATGLHCYQGEPSVAVRSEMQKRLSGCVFRFDKELAMLTGRPPALGRRYYTCPTPLDLDDDVLVAGGEILQEEIAALDERGWNKKGATFPSTLCRFVVLAAMLLDEIMELFLGSLSDFRMDRVNELRTRTIETFAPIPHLISATKDSLRISAQDPTPLRPVLLWRPLLSRMEYLRIHFLLECLSVERGLESKKRQLEISREMVDLTLFPWLERGRGFTITKIYDLDSTLIVYGIPAVGIICTELLKQTRLNHTPSSCITPDIKLPTAEIVQNLSHMIAFLEWIAPDAGNYKLCQHIAKVIKRVLEQVFQPPTLITDEHQSNKQAEQSTIIGGFEPSLWTAGVNGLGMGLDDLEWLNTVDWIVDPFMM